MKGVKNCKFCASTDMRELDKNILDFEYGSPDSYTYWRCGQCGVLQIDPLPDETILNQAYPSSYHAYHDHQSRVARFLKRRYWHKKAKRYSQYIAKESSILELGCSFGDLLNAFRFIPWVISGSAAIMMPRPKVSFSRSMSRPMPDSSHHRSSSSLSHRKIFTMFTSCRIMI